MFAVDARHQALLNRNNRSKHRPLYVDITTQLIDSNMQFFLLETKNKQ